MRKILHTMIRVASLERSIDFYTNVMGMRMLRTLDQPKEKYRLVFLGFGEESETAVLELTYNYGVKRYELGNAFGHIAIKVDNCQLACDEIKEKGVEITYGPSLLPGSNEIIAFINDPDGYQLELIEKPD